MDPQVHSKSQRSTTSLREELAELARLGAPIALVQFGMTSLNFVDVAFLGRYPGTALSSMALGNTLSWAALVFCLGVMAAVDPLLSQAIGAKDREAVTRTLLRGAVLAAILTIPFMLILLPAETWLEWLGQKPELIGDAATYARINTFGFLPFLWFALIRSLLSSHSRVGAQVLAILMANVLNAVIDYAWIFGNFGFPEMGVAGAAWATVTCRWAMFFFLLLLSRKELGPHLRHMGDKAVRTAALAIRPLLRLLKLGTPIGLQFALEMGVFAATALLIGTFDAEVGRSGDGGPRLGGHQVAIQLASLSFMIPLGISLAASVRIGWAIGRGDHGAARRSLLAALLSGAAVMTVFMLLFLLWPGQLTAILTDQPDIAEWAIVLIPIAGIFQIGDGLQVVAVGCLRGVGEVRAPLIINACGFWGIGLPIGCWLAFPWGFDMGPAGLWWGLVIGLFAVAFGLLATVRRRFGEERGRLHIE